MAEIRSFKDLLVWQKGMQIVKLVYELTKFFPKEEIYGLTSQIRRASTSIPLNIAEGYGRNSRKSYASFLRNARASNQEVETAVLVAIMLKFINEDDARIVLDELEQESKMLNALIDKIGIQEKEDFDGKLLPPASCLPPENNAREEEINYIE